MLEVLPTRAELNARERLARYVDEAKHDCAAFGRDLDWEASVWDIRKHCPKPSFKAGQSANLYFTTHENGTAKGLEGRRDLAEPFASFIKAIVRRKQDARPQTFDPLSRVINASRDLYLVLEDRRFDPVQLTHADFEAAAGMAWSRSSPSTAYRLGQALAAIAETIDRHGLSKSRLDWTNPIRKGLDRHSRTSEAAIKAGDEKLPAPFVLDEIARLSHILTEPDEIVRMACIKLLHCAPWRIGEVLSLAVDCEVEEQKVGPQGPVLDDQGCPVLRFGIRYWKEKSKNADIKWIPTVMVDVARRALAEIRQHTQGARELARWLEAHPGRAFLPGPDLGPNQTYTTTEIGRMMGARATSARLRAAGREWLEARNISLGPHSQSRILVCRSDLESALLEEMVQPAPDRRRLRLSQHLFLTFGHFYHGSKATNPCVLSLTRDQQISDFLCGRKGEQATNSIFERHGSRMPDGSPIVITSHMFRHWLNTLAQAGGLDQALVARWSGRDDLHQNAIYDHLSGLELAEEIRGMVQSGKVHGALAEIHKRKKDPIERTQFRETVFATAHITDIGMCNLDWITSECPEFNACATCEDCLVVKGDERAKARAEELRDDTAWSLERTMLEVDDGTIGASNHAKSQSDMLTALNAIIAIHNDPNIPNGSIVQPNIASPDHYAGPSFEASR